jgi:dynein heavy chain, axonemal
MSACRERLRQFPSIVNCCTIDWFTSWPRDALEAVAHKFLLELDSDNPTMHVHLTEMCKIIHEDVHELSGSFKQSAGRVNYVTPTSYLELLTMFTTLLHRQRGIVSMQKKRYTVRHFLLRTPGSYAVPLLDSSLVP